MWRYELFVMPVGEEWRVSILDGGARLPERMREFPTEADALAYAKGLAEEITRLGDQARTILSRKGEPIVVHVIGQPVAR